jgi:hypothetical protein
MDQQQRKAQAHGCSAGATSDLANLFANLFALDWPIQFVTG